MADNYYFDSDERDYSVKPPRITDEEIDELNNNDENWFKYMMKKEPLVCENENENQTYMSDNINYIIDSESIDDEYSIYDSEDYELDDN